MKTTLQLLEDVERELTESDQPIRNWKELAAAVGALPDDIRRDAEVLLKLANAIAKNIEQGKPIAGAGARQAYHLMSEILPKVKALGLTHLTQRLETLAKMFHDVGSGQKVAKWAPPTKLGPPTPY